MGPLPLIVVMTITSGLVASIGVVKRVGVAQAELDTLKKTIETDPSSKVIEWMSEHVLAGLKWKIVNKFVDIQRVVYCRHVMLDLLTMELPTYECTYFATLIDDSHILDRLEIERTTWDEDNGVGVGDSVHPSQSPGVRHMRYDMADGSSQCRAYKHTTVAAGWEWQVQEEQCPPSGSGVGKETAKTEPTGSPQNRPADITNTIANDETKGTIKDKTEIETNGNTNSATKDKVNNDNNLDTSKSVSDNKSNEESKEKSKPVPKESETAKANGAQEKKTNDANDSKTSAPPSGDNKGTSAPPSGDNKGTSAPPSGDNKGTSAPPSGDNKGTSAPPSGASDPKNTSR